MKKNKTAKMQSITAIVDGLLDGGCEYTTNFPGFHSHEIFDLLGGKQISLNEKVAFQLGFGASMAGRRSVVSMKSTGLNVALDEYLHCVLNGVNSGLVLILTEDLEGKSSPERQDSRPIIDMYGGLWLEPYSLQNAYDLAYKAFQFSEELDTPVVIRLTNNYFRQNGKYSRKKKTILQKKVESRRKKYISHWKSRDNKLSFKNKRIQSFVETLHTNINVYDDNDNEGVIEIGATNNKFAKQNILQLFSYPLPILKVKNYVSGRDKLKVVENGDSYALGKLHEICSTKQFSLREEKLHDEHQWKKWDKQRKLFAGLKSIKPSFVVADEGTFTDESTNTNNVCLCMGSSIGIAMGFAENKVNYPFCVIGDTSFLFGGAYALVEAVHRKLNFGVIVIDNGGAQSTGGQNLAGEIYNLDLNIHSQIVSYKKTTTKQFGELLNNIRQANKLSILYVKE